MFNELIFLTTIIIDLAFVLLAFKQGKAWLYVTIGFNLVLIGIFGGKLIHLFGFLTNAGNGFYGATFLASHMMVERYGKREALKGVVWGFVVLICFVLLAQLSIRLTGVAETKRINDSLELIFKTATRITIASSVAYFAAHFTSISIYEWLKKVTKGELLWVRDQVSNAVGQLVDSLLFFIISFYGKIPLFLLVEILVVGFVVKTLVGVVGLPFLYASQVSKKK